MSTNQGANQPPPGTESSLNLSQLGELAPLVEAYLGQVTKDITTAILDHVDQRLQEQEQNINQQLHQISQQIDARMEKVMQNLAGQIDAAVDKKAQDLIAQFAPALKDRLAGQKQSSPDAAAGRTASGGNGKGASVTHLISPQTAEKALDRLIDGITRSGSEGMGEFDQALQYLEKAEALKNRLMNALGVTGPPESRYYRSIEDALMQGIKIGQKKGGPSIRAVETNSAGSAASSATPRSVHRLFNKS